MYAAQLTKGEEVMTDYQYKSMMAMVYGMFEKCKTIEDYKETNRKIAVLSGGLAQADAEDTTEGKG